MSTDAKWRVHRRGWEARPAQRDLARTVLLVNLGRKHDDTDIIADVLNRDYGYNVERINLNELAGGFANPRMDLTHVAAVDLKDVRGWQGNYDHFKRQMQILEQKIEAVKKATGREIPIINPPKMFDWIASKEYLEEFKAKGIPIVPTEFITRPMVARGEWPDMAKLIAEMDANPEKTVVLKPARGARAADVWFISKIGENKFEMTCCPDKSHGLEKSPTPHVAEVDRAALESHLKGYADKRFSEQQPCFLVEPYCQGKEISAVFIGDQAHYVERTGRIAHEDFGGKNIPLDDPDPALVEFARRVRKTLPEDLRDSPYLRVDMIYDGSPPKLLEVEAGSARLFLTDPDRTDLYARMVNECVVAARKKSRNGHGEPNPIQV